MKMENLKFNIGSDSSFVSVITESGDDIAKFIWSIDTKARAGEITRATVEFIIPEIEGEAESDISQLEELASALGYRLVKIGDD